MHILKRDEHFKLKEKSERLTLSYELYHFVLDHKILEKFYACGPFGFVITTVIVCLLLLWFAGTFIFINFEVEINPSLDELISPRILPRFLFSDFLSNFVPCLDHLEVMLVVIR